MWRSRLPAELTGLTGLMTSDSMLRPVCRKAVCLLTHFKLFYCCTFSLHFNSFDHENSVFCLIHKEKKTAAVFNTAVPRECAEPLQLFVIQRILVQYDFHRPLMLLFHTLTAELSRSSVNIYSHKITLNQP